MYHLVNLKVIEKATLDTFLVGEEDPWNVTSETQKTIDTILQQVSFVKNILQAK